MVSAPRRARKHTPIQHTPIPCCCHGPGTRRWRCAPLPACRSATQDTSPELSLIHISEPTRRS
eukprot:3441241-Prymnesium_polylepis.1